jgi:ComF family protein
LPISNPQFYLMSVLEQAIGWLAPAECISCGEEGSALCSPCSLSEIIPYGERCFGCAKMSPRCQTCQACRAKNSPNFVWVCTDYEKTAKDLVQKLKFAHQRSATHPIASLMADTFLNFNPDWQILKKNYIIVPVPTATSRVRQRSFDHTGLIAARLADRLKTEPRNLLQRLGQSRQVGSKRYTRIRQLKDSFYVSKPEYIKRRNILLVDDVVTTGATLQEAAKTLRRAGARSVDALVFAKKL